MCCAQTEYLPKNKSRKRKKYFIAIRCIDGSKVMEINCLVDDFSKEFVLKQENNTPIP